MFRLLFSAAFLQCTISQQYQEKVAPGVPPQNYQPPNYQQVVAGSLVVADVDQQPPPQQNNVPASSQQHGDHEEHGDPQFLNPANIANEKDHIQEHLDVPIDISKMSEQELQFYYFKMHDSDNNNKLDGCELLKSLTHYHYGRKVEVESSIDEIEGSSIVDKLMRKADFDADGFVTFPEWTYNHRNLERETILLKNGRYAYV